ncbi:F-box protein [Phanerochaete sordida]|uniref:F-box protein n=1 Tax=Phanerochaete sordida TaxID=48140 RepID=A0A9P3LEV8_9APHY|nr:F-box protein [Phanerochaete sordida]
MLDTLPPELLFYTLEYLPLPSLSAVRQVSKQWNQRFIEHEPYIYRNAAFHHHFISSPEMTLEAAVEQARTVIRDVSSWTEFCRQRYLSEKNWLGRGRAWCRGLAEDHDDVHRIKVDEERGIALTTHQDGGLNVRDLETDHILWGLPRTYVRRYAHCEYGNGFLIFDRFGQGKEVWRVSSDPEESPAPRDDSQHQICETISRYIPETKGTFKPWAVLTTPEATRAYRFVYPTLLVAGAENAYLWDVPRCEIVQVIPDIQASIAGENLGRINYVELSPLHVIICGGRQLRLFDRTSGACVWHLQTTTAGPPCRSLQYTPASVPPANIYDLAMFTRAPGPNMTHRSHFSQCVAVHVSSDGRTIAALDTDASLLIVKDIVPVIANRVKLADASVIISFKDSDNSSEDSAAIYLAFEFGRIGVITSSGIYIVTLDATRHDILDRDEAHEQQKAALTSGIPAQVELARSPFPFLHVCQLLPFTRLHTLHNVSCLQMTQGKMFFTWDPRAMPGMDPDDDAREEFDFRWNGDNVDFAEDIDVEEDDDGGWEDEEDDDGEPPTLVNGAHILPAEAQHAQYGEEDEADEDAEHDEDDDAVELEDAVVVDDQQQQPAAQALPQAFAMIQNMINEAIVACVSFTPLPPVMEDSSSSEHDDEL